MAMILVALGSAADIRWYTKVMFDAFEIGENQKLGDSPEVLKEVKILNRSVRLHPHGISMEADPRHAEILSRSVGLQECLITTPPPLD